MAAQSDTQRADEALAGRQHGVVARWQLLDAGLSRHQIAVRLAAGCLHELHDGVYLAGHTIAPPLAREQAALLATGPQAVLSHASAAALWNILPRPAPMPVCVTLPYGRTDVRHAIEVHRAPLEPEDVHRRKGLAVTRPPRTILDLAAATDLDELEQIVAEAAYRRLASERELRDQLARHPSKPGGAKLRRMLSLPLGLSGSDPLRRTA